MGFFFFVLGFFLFSLGSSDLPTLNSYSIVLYLHFFYIYFILSSHDLPAIFL